MFIHRKEKDNNKENINLLGPKETQRLSFKIRLPRLPKLKMKLFKFGGKESKSKMPEKSMSISTKNQLQHMK